MKNTFMVAAVALSAMVAAPAVASDFQGPRVEVTAGVDDVKNGVDFNDVTYGLGVGYDHQFGRVVVGAEATADNVFERRDLGVAARLGYVVNENVLVYAKAGYTNWEMVKGLKLDGLRVGGGMDVNLTDNVFVGGEYRYTDFEAGVGRHGVLAKIGYRF